MKSESKNDNSSESSGDQQSTSRSSSGKNGSSSKGQNKSERGGGKQNKKSANGRGQNANKNQTPSSDKPQKTLQQMFEELLKDTYNAEQQLVKALPKVADAAFDEDLKDSIEDHWEQTKGHVRRLEKIFSILRYNIESPRCEAMEGLVEESDTIIKEIEAGPIRDCALIIGSQKIEHYEMAVYGSLRTLANVLGYYKVEDILDRTLEDEENADQILNEHAEYINLEAAEVSISEEEED